MVEEARTLERRGDASVAILLKFALLAALLACRPAAAEEVLRVAVSRSAPFAMLDGAGRLIGFDVEVSHAICKILAVRCEIEAMPFREVLVRLDAGTVDFAAATIAITPERQKRFLFTQHYWRSSSVLVGKAGVFQPGKAPSLDGKRIAVSKGTIQDEYLHRHVPEAVEIPFGTSDDGFPAVAAGQADLSFVPIMVALRYLSEPAGQNLAIVGDPVVESGGQVGIALPLGREPLRDRLDRALHEILTDGRYDAIVARYFPFNVY